METINLSFDYLCRTSLVNIEATLLKAKLQKCSDVNSLISNLIRQIIPLYRACENELLSESESENGVVDLYLYLQNSIIQILCEDLTFNNLLDLFFQNNVFVLTKKLYQYEDK